MKLEVKNSNGVVSSAHFDSNKTTLNLVINTVERWVEHDSIYSENDYISFMYEVKDNDDDYNSFDEVRLIAENEEDRKVIGRLMWEQHCKAQLWIVFLDESVYETKTMN